MGDPAPGKVEADRAGWFVRDYFPSGVAPLSAILFDGDGTGTGIDFATSTFTTGIDIGVCATSAINIGASANGVVLTGVTAYAIDIATSGFVRVGVQGTGIPVTTAYPYVVEIHAKTGSDIEAGTSGLSCGLRCRYEIGHDQTEQISMVAVEGRLRPKKDLGDGCHAGVSGTIEASEGAACVLGGTSTTQRNAGNFCVELGTGVTCTSGWLTGVTIDSSTASTVSMASCTYAGLRIKTSSGKEEWEHGIYLDDASATTGITLGTSTTGISIGACTTGIDISGACSTAGVYLRNQTETLFDGVTTMTLSAAHKSAIKIQAISAANAAYEVRGLYILAYPSTAEQATSKIRGIHSEVSSLLNIDNMTAVYGYANLGAAKTIASGSAALHGDVNVNFATTLSAGRLAAVWAQVRGDSALGGNLDCIYVDAEMNVDNAIYVNVDSAKTATTGITFAGSGTYTTGISFTGTYSGACIEMGTSGTPLSSSTEEHHFLSSYYTAAGKNIFGWYLSISQTYATDGAPRGLTIRTSLDHTSGFGPQGANSVDARVTLGDTNTGISGEMHAMESQLKIDADTRSLNGTYSAHKFTNYIKDGNTMPATTFFLRFVDQNGASVATPLMFDFSGITAGASNCIVANSGALAAAEYFLRVKSPDGGTGYIPILSALN
ncbi:MAG: hypothetical protein IMF11_09140 [Proteobacteria bacterium]|nr:hypothetical protein [Pseudomonadota bacterium]